MLDVVLILYDNKIIKIGVVKLAVLEATVTLETAEVDIVPVLDVGFDMVRYSKLLFHSRQLSLA
jgi:hypothetical protein